MTMNEWTGSCVLCGGTFSKRGMTRHLQACLEKHAGAKGGRRTGRTRLFHLLVEGRYLPMYWLHLEMPATAKFADLDAFLRGIWLECCGHLSAFEIGDESYDVQGLEAALDVPLFGPVSGGMDESLAKVVCPGKAFTYVYDFGSTTHLALRVVGERRGRRPREAVSVLARNDPPAIACEECGAAATLICASCGCNGVGWLCEKCVPKHECGDEYLLPVVNSPRVGVCGYTGDAGAGWFPEE